MKLRANELIKDCLTNFSNYEDVSLLDGSSGFLLLLLNLYLRENDEFYENKAIKVIRKMDFNFSISNQNRGLWTGVIGLSYVVSLWKKYSCNEQLFERLDLQLSEASKMVIETYFIDEVTNFTYPINYDILYGLAGIIIYTKYHEKFKNDENLDRRLSVLIEEVIQNNEKFNRFFWIDNTKELNNPTQDFAINFSLSHGIISLINSALLLENLDSSLLLDRLNGIYRNLVENKARFPEFIKINSYDKQKIEFLYNKNNENFSWCYGVYGHYIFQKNNNSYYFDSLKNKLSFHVRELIKNDKMITNNVCFCHGLAGLLYSCNDGYSNKEVQACCKLLEKNYFNNEVLDEYSVWGVLDGKIGILLSYIAIKYRKKIVGEEIFGIFG